MTVSLCIALSLLLCATEVLRRTGGSVASGLLLSLLLACAVGITAELLARPGRRRPGLWSLCAALPCLVAFPAFDTAARRALQVYHGMALATAWAAGIAPAVLGGWLAYRALSRGTTLGVAIRAALSLCAGVGVLLAVLLSALPFISELAIHVVYGYLTLGFIAFALRMRLLAMVPATLGFSLAAAFGPARYVELAAIFTCSAVLSGACAVHALELQRPRASARVLSALALATFAAAHGLARGSPGAYAAAGGSGALSGLVHFAHVASDVDQDGYGALFVQRDCAPFDPAVAPHRHERLDNFIDDNCRGGSADGSLLTWVEAQEALHPPPPRLGRDVVIVLIDALRHDVAHSDAMPTLTSWARQGVDFTRAYSTSSFTASVLGGVLAARHAASIELSFYSRLGARPSKSVGGLAPWLRKLGYQTGLAGRFPDTPLYFDDAYADGFSISEYAEQHAEPEVVGRAALTTWQKMDPDRPRLLFVHHMYVHNPEPRFEVYQEHARRVDDNLAWLRQRLGDDAIWIVLSDHGEEFGEHGGGFHASTLYEEVVRVPLIVRAPGLSPARIDAVSSLRSILPTVMALVGHAPDPDAPGPYLCLSPPCRDMPAPMSLELQDRHLHGLVVGHRKILRDFDRGHVEAFDLRADPGEKAPLSPIPPDLVEQLVQWEEAALGPRPVEFFWPYAKHPPW